MGQVDPDISIGPLLRLGAIAAVFVIAGAYLAISQSLQPVPASVDGLTRVEGPVILDKDVRRSRRTTTEYPVLVINGTRYSYLDWFPQSKQLPMLVRPGENLTIWTDANQQKWVWQIQRNGETIIAFEAIRQAVANHQKYSMVAGVVFILIGIGLGVAFAIKSRPLWVSEPQPKRKAAIAKPKKKKPRPKSRLKELPESD